MARSDTRLSLDRDQILKAALELADGGGIEAVTMRKLGQALGFEAMSLYHYFPKKDDVINGILDLVLATIQPPSSMGEWDVAIRTSALSVHRALMRHPWASAPLLSTRRVRPARRRYADSVLARLSGAGFSAETRYHAYLTLEAHTFGFALWQTSSAANSADVVSALAQVADEFPYLYELAIQHHTDGPYLDEGSFEFGLDLILDGLRRMRKAELRIQRPRPIGAAARVRRGAEI